MFPVSSPGFQGPFAAGFGRKDIANGPKFGLKLPGPQTRSNWDQVLTRSHQLSG
jgi:hypothetical protein